MVIVFYKYFDALSSEQKLHSPIGFWRELCDTCQGEGTLEHSPIGEYPPPPQDE